MAPAFDTVKQVHAKALSTGAASTVLQFDNLGTLSQYRSAYELTARHVKPGHRVLDWGCGNGHFSVFLELLGASVTGYSFEPAPPVMQASPSFTFVPGTPNEPSALPFRDGEFDAAVSMGVLEHVWETGGDERASLLELARVVKPGGAILTFHFPSSTGWIENMVRRLRLKKHLHGRRYGAERIAELWSGAGITLLDVDRYNVLPRSELKLLPAFIRHSETFVRGYNALDDALGRAAPRVCTNYLVVGRTRA